MSKKLLVLKKLVTLGHLKNQSYAKSITKNPS